MRFVHLSLCMSLLWFIYPDEAYCSGCKKCNQRAAELRQRLLEQQPEATSEPQGYDISMTDWGKNISQKSDSETKESETKKKKKKKKKDDKDKKDKKSKSGS